MTTLRARLLGRPAFEADGAVLPFSSRKAQWLAAFLFLARAPVPRARVASLFWGSDSPPHALGSLRVALTKLPAPVLERLVITRDELGVAKEPPYTLDVDAFAERCADPDPAAQASGLALYGGHLLEGVEEDLAPEFSDWLLPERARIKQLAHDAHLRVAQHLHERGERARAREVVDAWLRLDSAAEAMHRLLMAWLPGDQALAHYEVYRRARAVAHGAPPSEEMAAAAERLRHGPERATRDAPSRISAATSFFGRADELAELRGLLGDPGCRLLTLHGLGGVGKTRLAETLAEMEAPSFAHGVYVVPLAGVQTPRLFAPTLARACGLQPAPGAAPLDLVASFLGDHAALVVLDNLEHLLGDEGEGSLAAQVAALLRATGPDVRIVATSRGPLRLQEEWVYEVEGLAHPRPDGPEMDAQAAPAVQFFASRARQGYVGFSLAAELPNVVQICEVLEGLPLGLEIAASWVRSVPCAEIAASLRARAAELRNRHVNRAARHDSLGAVVAYSWERLSPEQRDALSGIGILLGSFSREAAEQVAQASLRSLSALTEKALLQRGGRGRWHVHEVVRQFAWEQPDATPKARGARQAALERRRNAFYLEYLRLAEPKLEGPEEPDALAAIEEEIANIRAAWHSAAQAGEIEALDGAALAWFEFLESRRFVDEGRNAVIEWREAASRAGLALSVARADTHLSHFEQLAGDIASSVATAEAATAALDAREATPDLVRALVEKAFNLSHLGKLKEAEEVGKAGLAAAETLGDEKLMAYALTIQGNIVVRVGKGEDARRMQRRALEIATRLGRPSSIARVHNNLALAENFLGEYRAAEAGYERSYRIWTDLRMTRVAGLAMHNLGVVSQRMGEYAKALERYRAALEMMKRAGDRKMIAINLMSTGDSLVRIGRPEEARAPLEEALRIAQRDGHALPIPYAHVMMAHAEVALGRHIEAAAHLLAAFEHAEPMNYTDVLAEGVVNAARLLAAAKPASRATALRWLRAMERMPEASARVHDDAARVAASLGAGIADAGVAAQPTLKELVGEARAAAIALKPSPRGSPVAVP